MGGENKAISTPAVGPMPAQDGDLTVNQMYVQYQIPLRSSRHRPVVMIHGCCLSGKTWETTPDGRAGWAEHFLRRNRAVYLADQVSRARSGFDPSAFYQVRRGERPANELPDMEIVTHQAAWLVFRLGPRFGEAFPDEQFPIEAVDELYKQTIPDLNSTLPAEANPTWMDLASLGITLGGSVLIGHSESGFFPERAALINSTGIKGIVSIETICETQLTDAQVGTLSTVPTLVMFGDHLDDVPLQLTDGKWTWGQALETCRRFVDMVNHAGGDATLVHLPELGIKGNSHMLMQDKNSSQLADLVISWIENHVDSPRERPRR